MSETTDGETGNGSAGQAPQPAPSDPMEEVLAKARTALATILENVEVTTKAANTAQENQTSVANSFADLQTKISELGSVATQALAAKTQIEDSQAVIATKTEHVEEARKQVDAARTELDKAVATANKAAGDAEAQRVIASSAAENSALSGAAVQAARTAAESDSAAIAGALTTARESATTTKKLAEKSDTVKQTLKQYETRLEELAKQCEIQLAAITKLLPGATSAGLASSFETQKRRFKTPQKNWLIAGVVALSLLFLVGAIGLPGLPVLGSPAQDSSPDGGLLKHILTRLPLAIPLIWLAVYAGHNYMMALRMEEDYAFKEAVSWAFEGYKREMKEIQGVNPNDTAPLITLCTNVLTALAERPGRIYEGKHESITPMSQISKTLTELVDAVKNKPGQQPPP